MRQDMDKLIIGTRGSRLSLSQTEIIIKELEKLFPGREIEIKIIKTTGDKNMNPVPLDTVGKGWFTKELDKALLSGKIDLAVHSLKDLPEELPEGLVIAAIPEREDAREALISKGNISLDKLKKGAVIGTDSTRRKSQILHKRPDLIIKSLRGNVNGRLEKLDNGEFDAIFLAVAGLKRLGLEKRITQYFPPTDITPSPGQGALAITIRNDGKILLKQLKKLNHEKTILAVKAERAFSQALGGGCKMPVGAYATIKQNKIILYGFAGSTDGKYIFNDTLQGSMALPERLGINMAKTFLDKGYSWFDKPKFVVITRPENASIAVQKKIESLGLLTYFYPSISIAKSTLNKKTHKIISDIDSFDWLIFTSQNGVRFFLSALEEAGIPIKKLKGKKIAVVGKKTADAVKKYDLPVEFIPTRFTTEALANELEDVKGKKILMARANLATPILTKKLQEKGAVITDIPIYKTSFIENDNPEFENLLQNQQIYCITFTSPSTVTGFMNNIKNSHIRNIIFSLPAFSIGPVTTKVLEKQGFKNIYTADTYTINGMIAKLKESIL
jgi:hydroxymethylbilane synthase